MLHKYSSPLKIFALGLAAIGYFVSKELESREIDEKIDKALAEREAKAQD